MQKNYNENLCAGAAIRDDKGRRISKLFEASHPKMTVGYAKNLIMPDDPTEQEFNFRQAGGGVIEDGVAVIDKVKGNSVVWNQLIKDFREPSNWLTNGNEVTVVGDKIHIKFASEFSSNAFGVKSSAFSAGHKYYIQMNNENAVPLTAIKLGYASSVDNNGSTMNSPETPFITGAIPMGSAGDGAFWFWASDETKLEGDFSNIYVIDLTQMFGAGNEPSTVEEFLSRKPKVADEFAYNEGTIVNNKVEKVVTTGVNLWDESKRVNGKYIDHLTGEEISNAAYSHTGYVRVLPNTEYYFKQGVGEPQYGAYYDADKNFIPGALNFKGVFTTPAQAAYVRITLEAADSSDNICINLSDPSINGKYFPYEKHELDLSWIKDIKDSEGVKLFEDGMKSAGTAFDEVGKNKAVKRLGSMDLGTLTPRYSDYDKRAYYTGITYIKNRGYLVYPKGVKGGVSSSDTEWNISFSDGILYIRVDNFPGPADFKAAMSGVMLIYELAEPIEVEYDEKNLTYPVVAGGTEEAIASEPSTAFRADIGYGIDAVKTILDLKARVKALEGK